MWRNILIFHLHFAIDFLQNSDLVSNKPFSHTFSSAPNRYCPLCRYFDELSSFHDLINIPTFYQTY